MIKIIKDENEKEKSMKGKEKKRTKEIKKKNPIKNRRERK